MKGNFSRLTRGGGNADARRVLLQQGRVLLDSDWNDQSALLRRRIETGTRDIIGPQGGPSDNAGFDIGSCCAIHLNQGGQMNGQYQQCLLLPPSWSLPLGPQTSPPDERPDHAPAPLPVAPPHLVDLCLDSDEPPLYLDPLSERPFTVQMSVRVPPIKVARLAARQITGALLSQPGGFTVAVDAQRYLVLTCAGTPPVSQTTTVPLPEGFSNVVLSYDGAQLRLYIGALLAATCPFTGAPPGAQSTQSPVLVVAAEATGEPAVYTNYLPCAVESLRIWTKALDGVVLDHYQKHDMAGPVLGLVCDWDLCAVHDFVIPDRTPYGNNGTITTAGSAPPVTPVEVRIGAGHYYVDGILCINPRPVRLNHQPFYPRSAIAFDRDPTSYFLVYLDVWERFITALQDPHLLEVALGGPDTAGRVETVWQVKLLAADSPEKLDRMWHELNQAGDHLGHMRARQRDPLVAELGNDLYRVEIDNPGWALASPMPASSIAAASPVVVVQYSAGKVTVNDPLILSMLSPGSPVLLFVLPSADDSSDGTTGSDGKSDDNDTVTTSATTLQTVVVAVGHDHTVELLQLPDPLGQTQRVSLLPLATFKWSHENAMVALPVASIDADTVTAPASGQSAPSAAEPVSVGVVTLSGLGYNGMVAAGDWVELTNDANDLLLRPGSFHRVLDTDPTLLQVTISDWQPPPSHAAEGIGAHPILRRWDATRATKSPAGQYPVQVIQADAWMPLDKGLEVEFSAHGAYLGGDFWTFPVRSQGQPPLEWPGTADDPMWLPPQGIEHHYAPLADLSFANGQSTMRDRRTLFSSLAALSSPRTPARLRADDPLGAVRAGAGPAAPTEKLLDTPASGVNAWARAFLDWLEHWHVTHELPPPQGPEELSRQLLRYLLDRGLGGQAALLARPGLVPPGLHATGQRVAVDSLASSAWQPMPSAPSQLSGPGRAVLVGSELVFVTAGGSLWRCDLDSGRWRQQNQLPRLRRDFQLAVLGPSMYLIGGRAADSGDLIADIDVLTAGAWRPRDRPRLYAPVTAMAVAPLGSALYVYGGADAAGAPMGTVQRIDTSAAGDVVSAACTPMPVARSGHTATAFAGAHYLIGGVDSSGNPTSACTRYDPVSGVSSSGRPLPRPLSGHAAVAVRGGILVAGGSGPDRTPSRAVYLYRPGKNTWTELCPMSAPRRDFGLVAESEILAPDDARAFAVGGDFGSWPAGSSQPAVETLDLLTPLEVVR